MTRRVAVLVAVLAWAKGAAAESDGRLGSRCDEIAACAEGLTCLTPGGEPQVLVALGFGACTVGLNCADVEGSNPGRGGPAGGLCSAPCAADEDCQVHAATARCFWDGLCHESCDLGAPVSNALDSSKCHGRDDMACFCSDPYCVTSGVCMPLCVTDEQCGAGFSCNQANGLCEDSVSRGELPLGGACAGAQDPACFGICDVDATALVEGTLSFACSRPCVIGSEVQCPNATEEGRISGCLRPLSFHQLAVPAYESGSGDIGICVDLCNCTSDCNEGEVCDLWDLGGRYDAAGVCARGSALKDAPDCLHDAGAAGAPSFCDYGPVRACKTDDCLGTAECLADGSYGECRCIDDHDGAGGAGDSTKATPAVDDGSGCGCRVGSSRSVPLSLSILVLFALVFRRVSSRARVARGSSTTPS